MSKAIFYPTKEGDVAPYTNNIVEKLTINGGALATELNVAPDDIALLNGYVTDIPVKINNGEIAMATAKAVNEDKTSYMKNAKSTTLNMIQVWARNDNWTHNTGVALGVYKEHTPVDLNTVKPRITEVDVHPDMVIIEWVRGRMEGVAVYDSLDGNTFQRVDKDTKSPWEDTRPTPNGGPQQRHYRLRYLKDDKEVGLFSETVTVLVSIAG